MVLGKFIETKFGEFSDKILRKFTGTSQGIPQKNEQFKEFSQEFLRIFIDTSLRTSPVNSQEIFTGNVLRIFPHGSL